MLYQWLKSKDLKHIDSTERVICLFKKTIYINLSIFKTWITCVINKNNVLIFIWTLLLHQNYNYLYYNTNDKAIVFIIEVKISLQKCKIQKYNKNYVASTMVGYVKSHMRLFTYKIQTLNCLASRFFALSLLKLYFQQLHYQKGFMRTMKADEMLKHMFQNNVRKQ